MSGRMDWERARQRDQARKAPPEPPVVAWWLTVARFDGRCDECRERIPHGSTYAYNHAEKRQLCSVCVDRLAIPARPSRRLLAEGRGRTK